MERHSAKPFFIYGTAWKEDRTTDYVRMALRAGFRAIDTANQRKHYFEAGVGEAMAEAMSAGGLKREELFLQTKFTFISGQDHRLPYDPRVPIAEQVQQSFQSSLNHLKVDYVDSLILHGPSQRNGLGKADFEAWNAMESLREAGVVRSLGVSNVAIDQLVMLWKEARFKPEWVQNRCYAITGWDHEIREFCRENGLQYQGFSLLTANAKHLSSPVLSKLAKRYQCTVPAIIFRFAIDAQMVPLTGTTSLQHMEEDLRALEFSLTADEVSEIERLAMA